MSDDTKAGGAGDQKSGAPSDKVVKDAVSYETYSKTMDDLKNTQRKLAEIEANAKKLEEQKLKDSNDWKTLAESHERRAKELEEKIANEEQKELDRIKLNAFQKNLGGKLKHDSYFNHVDIEKIAFNPDTKKVDPDSIKSVVANFLKEHSHLVDFGKKAGMPMDTKIDNTAGSGDKSVRDMTKDELQQHIIKMAQKGLIVE